MLSSGNIWSMRRQVGSFGRKLGQHTPPMFSILDQVLPMLVGFCEIQSSSGRVRPKFGRFRAKSGGAPGPNLAELVGPGPLLAQCWPGMSQIWACSTKLEPGSVQVCPNLAQLRRRRQSWARVWKTVICIPRICVGLLCERVLAQVQQHARQPITTMSHAHGRKVVRKNDFESSVEAKSKFVDAGFLNQFKPELLAHARKRGKQVTQERRGDTNRRALR